MPNPIGLHIQAQDPRINRAELIKHCIKADYTTVTVLDDFNLAIAIKNALPNCHVVYRSSDFEPSPSAYAVGHLKSFLNGLPQDKRIVIMVNCEQGYSPEKFNMWADMIEAADPMGWKLCVGNMAAGTVKSGQGSDPNEWIAMAERLLRVLAKYTGHFLGVHEYTSFFAWVVSNGQWGEHDKPPASINWSADQWHIGRFIQGIMKACDKFGIPYPKVIITEGVLDKMNDIAHLYPGVDAGGWRNLIELWSRLYKNVDAEDVLSVMHIWTWDKVYAALGFIVGIHTYTWGDASGNNRWEKFRVDQALTYQRNMEGYRPSIAIETPPVVVVTEPTEIANPLPHDHVLWTVGVISPRDNGDFANLRYVPSSENNTPFHKLVGSRDCLFAYFPDWGEWGQVKYEDNGVFIHAWVNINATTFKRKIVDDTPEMVTICLSVLVPADEAEGYRKTLRHFFSNVKYEAT